VVIYIGLYRPHAWWSGNRRMASADSALADAVFREEQRNGWILASNSMNRDTQCWEGVTVMEQDGSMEKVMEHFWVRCWRGEASEPRVCCKDGDSRPQ